MKAVLIITDIGGPPLLHELLSQLPPDYGVPVVVLQSFDVGIFEASTAVLQRTVQLQVSPLEAETPLLPGYVYFARPHSIYSVDDADGPLIVRTVEPSGKTRLGRIVSEFATVCDDQLAVLFLSGQGRAEELPEICQALAASRAEVLVLNTSEAAAPELGQTICDNLDSAHICGLTQLADYLRLQGAPLPRMSTPAPKQ